MTGPRCVPVHLHRTRARLLLPLLAAILLGQLACTEQSSITEPATTGISAGSTRLHPYLMSKPRSSATTGFAQVSQSAARVSFATSSASGSGARVLLLADEDGASTTDLANSVAAAGFLVSVRPAPEYTWDGTNPSLNEYDLVIHLNGNTFSSGQQLSAEAQTALVDFVRAGGGYVGSQWNSYEATDQQAVMQDLVLAGFPGPVEENCASCPISYSIVADQQGHALVAGIPSSFTFEADGHLGGPLLDFGTEPSVAVMELPSGTPGVLARNLGAGKVVSFSFAPNYSLAGDGMTLQDANIRQLYVNAVGWAARSSTQPPAKAPATITLADPVATFDGTAKGVSITTNPAGLTGVTVAYSQNGIPVAVPVNAGVYQVLATLDHPDYQAPQATGTLTIQQAAPVIQWVPAVLTEGTPLGSAQLNASAVGVDGASLGGEYFYLPGAGTVFTAGAHPVSVEFQPFNSNYRNVIKTVSISVLPVSAPPTQLNFKGFFRPIYNLPVANRVAAGAAIPVRFTVEGPRGARVLNSGSPTSVEVSCRANVLEQPVEETVSDPNSGLRSVGTDYTYVWRTSSTWAETCRKLIVTLADGSKHEALFRFSKAYRDDKYNKIYKHSNAKEKQKRKN